MLPDAQLFNQHIPLSAHAHKGVLLPLGLSGPVPDCWNPSLEQVPYGDLSPTSSSQCPSPSKNLHGCHLPLLQVFTQMLPSHSCLQNILSKSMTLSPPPLCLELGPDGVGLSRGFGIGVIWGLAVQTAPHLPPAPPEALTLFPGALRVLLPNPPHLQIHLLPQIA